MLSSLSRVLTRRIAAAGQLSYCTLGLIAPRQAWSSVGLHKTLIKAYVTSSSPSVAQNHRDDQKAAAGVVVYRGNLTTFIKVAKLLSLSSSVMGLVAQPMLYSLADSLPVAAMAGAGVLVLFFTYVTPLILHLITKKYVTEMRFEPGSRTFTATTLTFFIRPKRLHFRASDVYVPDVPGPFTTFLAKQTPLFVDFRQFTDIDSFRHLMGYDKPIDLKLAHDEKSD